MVPAEELISHVGSVVAWIQWKEEATNNKLKASSTRLYSQYSAINADWCTIAYELHLEISVFFVNQRSISQ